MASASAALNQDRRTGSKLLLPVLLLLLLLLLLLRVVVEVVVVLDVLVVLVVLVGRVLVSGRRRRRRGRPLRQPRCRAIAGLDVSLQALVERTDVPPRLFDDGAGEGQQHATERLACRAGQGGRRVQEGGWGAAGSGTRPWVVVVRQRGTVGRGLWPDACGAQPVGAVAHTPPHPSPSSPAAPPPERTLDGWPCVCAYPRYLCLGGPGPCACA